MQPESYKKTFQITRFGVPISEFAVINSIDTGIEFEAIPGILPDYLVVNACNAANYTFYGTWQEISPKQQAFHIAHYIANSFVEQHKNDAEARKIKQAK